MKSYYINLASRPQRRAAMEERFVALGLPFERIEAKTPADVTDAQRRRFCNPLAYRWQTEGELACSLSHLAAMQVFLDSGEPYAAIFEDDAILSPALPGLLASYESAGLGIDVLRIETDNGRLRIAPRPLGEIGTFRLLRLYSAGGGAAAYVVSRVAAQRALAGDEVLGNLTDQALFNPYAPLSRDLVVRQLDPALAIQEDRLGQPGDRLASSDLEILRVKRGSSDRKLFWRRWAFNFYDFLERDVVAALRNLWLKHARGVVKYAIPFKAD